MTDEERRRQMDFILEQQARFLADIRRLQGSHAEADKRMTRLEQFVANSYVDPRDRYNARVNAQVKSEEKIAKLAEAQANLTAVAGRYFSEGRDGKPWGRGKLYPQSERGETKSNEHQRSR